MSRGGIAVAPEDEMTALRRNTVMMAYNAHAEILDTEVRTADGMTTISFEMAGRDSERGEFRGRGYVIHRKKDVFYVEATFPMGYERDPVVTRFFKSFVILDFKSFTISY